MSFAQMIAVAGSFIGASLSAACALLAWSLNRKGQRAQAHEQMNQRYDRLMAFRVEHPEVLSLSRQWVPACYSHMYGTDNDMRRQWVLYYTYVELILGFCNAVEYARRRGLLDRVGYESHY